GRTDGEDEAAAGTAQDGPLFFGVTTAPPAELLPDLAADASRLAQLVLLEDGPIDLTSAVALGAPRQARGTIECRTPTVIAGLRYAEAVATEAGCAASWSVAD